MKIQNYAWFKMHYGSLPHCFEATISFRSIIIAIAINADNDDDDGEKELKFQMDNFFEGKRDSKKHSMNIWKDFLIRCLCVWAVDGTCYDHFNIVLYAPYFDTVGDCFDMENVIAFPLSSTVYGFSSFQPKSCLV